VKCTINFIKKFFQSATILILIGCQKNNQDVILVPSHFRLNLVEPERNKASQEGILLGKKLFFDPMLSGNNSISCASCHKPDKAFSDSPNQFSRGINQKLTNRNTPALFNLMWSTTFFWDGGVKNLESLSIAPLHASNEMDQNLDSLVAELKQDPEYVKLFNQVFGSEIDIQKILWALAQYTRSLISANSLYDKYLIDSSTYILTSEQKLGRQVYLTYCASCHSGVLFTDHQFHNNGIDSIFIDKSELGVRLGRYRITLKEEDRGKFKTPSLRNLLFTAPYMHDGRFNTLDDVLNHYNYGVKYSPTLDTLLPRGGFKLENDKINALKSFLYLLNDSNFVKQDLNKRAFFQ
jgi:cytochrome c peroxidase